MMWLVLTLIVAKAALLVCLGHLIIRDPLNRFRP